MKERISFSIFDDILKTINGIIGKSVYNARLLNGSIIWTKKIRQSKMSHSVKKLSIPVFIVLIAVITSADAQAGSWYPSPSLNQIKIWLSNGNLNFFLNQSPLKFTVVAAMQQVVALQTNHDVWIVVQESKKKGRICHCKGSKQNNKNYINVNWITCYKCKKLKKLKQPHHSHSSSTSTSSSTD